MTNVALAEKVLRACAAAGVAEVVLCAGARNAPLVEMLSAAEGVRVYSFFEERSASFFALGRMQATHRPVAVITTSGTAVAELLPATIEAFHQGLPLILLTADRPRHYRGSGAPQTIVQPGIFSCYVEKSWDVESEWNEELAWSGRAPIHLNVCFQEPLLDAKIQPWNWLAGAFSPESATAKTVALAERRPLVIVSGLTPSQARRVQPWLEACQRPVFIEATSQLRGKVAGALRVPRFDDIDFDCVIRIGAVPTLRFWRDLESSSLPVYHFSEQPFSGLPRARQVWPLSVLVDFDFEAWPRPPSVSEREQRLEALLERYPLSEPGWVNWLSRQLPSNAGLFLGNSLPIREWDLAAAWQSQPEISANRGVNGIDGLISTFLGWGDEDRSNWALLGDLSALYDLSGPWAWRQRPLKDLNLVVINNSGGKIFHRMFNNPLFENQHDLNFADWARMWGFDYVRMDSHGALAHGERPRVIEIVPEERSTAAFWQEWEKR